MKQTNANIYKCTFQFLMVIFASNADSNSLESRGYVNGHVMEWLIGSNTKGAFFTFPRVPMSFFFKLKDQIANMCLPLPLLSVLESYK